MSLIGYSSRTNNLESRNTNRWPSHSPNKWDVFIALFCMPAILIGRFAVQLFTMTKQHCGQCQQKMDFCHTEYSRQRETELDTPNSPPEECPHCGHKFSTLMRRQWRMQKKAMLLFLVGVLLIFPWAGLLFALASISPVIIVPRHPFAWVVVLIVICAPGLLVGRLAIGIPKMTTIRCSQCHWKTNFVRR